MVSRHAKRDAGRLCSDFFLNVIPESRRPKYQGCTYGCPPGESGFKMCTTSGTLHAFVDKSGDFQACDGSFGEAEGAESSCRATGRGCRPSPPGHQPAPGICLSQEDPNVTSARCFGESFSQEHRDLKRCRHFQQLVHRKSKLLVVIQGFAGSQLELTSV